MTEHEYVDLYYRDLELNLVAFKRVLDCEPHIRALAQIAYDMGFSAAKCGDARTTLDDWDKMPARYIQLADANVLRSKPGRKNGEDE
jgi:hypothetical protein